MVTAPPLSFRAAILASAHFFDGPAAVCGDGAPWRKRIARRAGIRFGALESFDWTPLICPHAIRTFAGRRGGARADSKFPRRAFFPGAHVFLCSNRRGCGNIGPPSDLAAAVGSHRRNFSCALAGDSVLPLVVARA